MASTITLSKLTCSHCGKTDAPPKGEEDSDVLLRCDRCFDALYCSFTCQSNDWTKHQVNCIPHNALSAPPSASTPPPARATAEQIAKWASKLPLSATCSSSSSADTVKPFEVVTTPAGFISSSSSSSRSAIKPSAVVTTTSGSTSSSSSSSRSGSPQDAVLAAINRFSIETNVNPVVRPEVIHGHPFVYVGLKLEPRQKSFETALLNWINDHPNTIAFFEGLHLDESFAKRALREKFLSMENPNLFLLISYTLFILDAKAFVTPDPLSKKPINEKSIQDFLDMEGSLKVFLLNLTLLGAEGGNFVQEAVMNIPFFRTNPDGVKNIFFTITNANLTVEERACLLARAMLENSDLAIQCFESIVIKIIRKKISLAEALKWLAISCIYNPFDEKCGEEFQNRVLLDGRHAAHMRNIVPVARAHPHDVVVVMINASHVDAHLSLLASALAPSTTTPPPALSSTAITSASTVSPPTPLPSSTNTDSKTEAVAGAHSKTT